MNRVSPCQNCVRTLHPELCEDKSCVRWRRWYLRQWAQIHGFYEKYRKERRR